MKLETGRTVKEQEAFERELIIDLEDASYATNDWGNKNAPEIYATRFIDAMLRIQAGDVNDIPMKHEVDPAGNEVVLISLPVVRPYKRQWVDQAYHRISILEKYEPNVRDLLPVEDA